MPLVSVVMSVYNDEERVGRSIDSILKQTFQDFEFIIINDGSTDGTAQVLDRYADQDSRIRVIHQDNTGLTQALIRGCQQAQGKFIARQDSGDISMPERLHAQSDFLIDHPDVSLVACSTSFVDPEGNIIFLQEQSGYELEQGLVLDIDKIHGPPHHGSTMFRNADYHNVGGYHPDFEVAQDIDLWLKLAEAGRCFCFPNIWYKANLDVKSISANRQIDQIYFTTLAIKSSIFRRNKIKHDISHDIYLSQNKKPQFNTKTSLQESNFYYFLGSCTMMSNPALARKYFIYSLSKNPFKFKAFIKIIFSFVRYHYTKSNNFMAMLMSKFRRNFKLLLEYPWIFFRKILFFIASPQSGWIILNKKINFYIDLSLEHSSVKLMYFDIYEYELVNLLSKTLKKGDIFIDVGANIGYISAYALSKVGYTGSVHAFEPVPKYFEYLKKLKHHNPQHTFIINSVALSSRSSVANIQVSTDSNFGWNIMVPGLMTQDSKEEIQVSTIRLDDYILKLDETERKSIKVIKIDVEGYEFEVLKGCKSFLSNSHYPPIIIVEICPSAYPKLDSHILELQKFMTTLHYSCYSLNLKESIDLTNLEQTTDVCFIPSWFRA